MAIDAKLIQQLTAVSAEPVLLLRTAAKLLVGRIAVLSSFGAESALLLAMVADAAPDLPILFLETGQHFPETLAYRSELARFLGLSNVQDIRPDNPQVTERDPTGELWAFDPDACCQLRKVEPLDTATLPYTTLVTGRKRIQASTRTTLPVVEIKKDGQLRLNPLALWTAEDIAQEALKRGLPPHPLVERGYPSIGCAPCTRPVGAGQDSRSGRWSGLSKTECGIHTAG